VYLQNGLPKSADRKVHCVRTSFTFVVGNRSLLYLGIVHSHIWASFTFLVGHPSLSQLDILHFRHLLNLEYHLFTLTLFVCCLLGLEECSLPIFFSHTRPNPLIWSSARLTFTFSFIVASLLISRLCSLAPYFFLLYPPQYLNLRLCSLPPNLSLAPS
jgi:hypothetical protein